MFDPTIFENIKVVLEGAIYDLDLSNDLKVINRRDIVDLATMSREFIMQIQTFDNERPYPFVEISVQSSIEDFTVEKIDENEKDAGCNLEVSFFTRVNDIDHDCIDIENMLNNLWNRRPLIHQEIFFEYGSSNQFYNRVNLHFSRKINEDQIEDIQSFIELTIHSLKYFEKF
ncbi:hypothetical protein [Bacillus sp. FJAT-45350]|uniref:hypothetical protein n=1 Tax=Bacillus sp. FJAT-45350 TaxID=2011014 RepID=UPI000BB999D8|nr:hypothetical protein [Bacillus sp. FJAT-45350]